MPQPVRCCRLPIRSSVAGKREGFGPRDPVAVLPFPDLCSRTGLPLFLAVTLFLAPWYPVLWPSVCCQTTQNLFIPPTLTADDPGSYLGPVLCATMEKSGKRQGLLRPQQLCEAQNRAFLCVTPHLLHWKPGSRLVSVSSIPLQCKSVAFFSLNFTVNCLPFLTYSR